MGIDPVTHRPRSDLNILAHLPQLLAAFNLSNSIMNNNPWENPLRLQSDATQLAKLHLLNNLLQVLGTSSSSLPPNMEAFNLSGLPSFPDHHQGYDYINSNSYQLINGVLTGVHPAGQPESVPCFAPPQEPEPGFEYQAMEDLKDCGGGNKYDGEEQLGSFYVPALVPASPELTPVNQTEKKTGSGPGHDMSNPSSTSTTFEAWGELMDEEATESYWRDLIE